MSKNNILIATPCYGGMCYVAYMTSLMNTQNYFRNRPELGISIDATFVTCDSLVTRARNTLTARFLANKKYTHLLFIDADIQWKPDAIEELVKTGKDVIGGCYPKKEYRWERAVKLVKDGEKMPELQHCLMDYVVHFNGNKIVNGLIPVDYIGTGFLMISRNTLETLYHTLPDTHYQDHDGDITPEENKWLFNIFDTAVHSFGVDDKRLLSEDYLFCERYKNIGGQIWLCPKIQLTHIGQHYYIGNFGKTIEINL